MDKIKFTLKGRREKGGKNVDINKCTFSISETKSVSGDKEKATFLELKEGEKSVGGATIEECNNKELAQKFKTIRYDLYAVEKSIVKRL